MIKVSGMHNISSTNLFRIINKAPNKEIPN